MMTYEQPAPDMTCDKPAPDAGLRRVIRANVLTVVFEVIVPMVLFYGLRAAGVSRTIAELKRGAEGAAAWAARWDTDTRFRRGLRIDTAAWGAVLLANAVLHVVLVYTLPIDLISGVTTVEWFASLALLITWHVWYTRKENGILPPGRRAASLPARAAVCPLRCAARCCAR